MVSDLPPVLPAVLVTLEEADHGHHCWRAVGPGTGMASSLHFLHSAHSD